MNQVLQYGASYTRVSMQVTLQRLNNLSSLSNDALGEIAGTGSPLRNLR